jgi:hypothetical protein
MAQELGAPEVLDIFCDESGFTGQHLLNPDQRYFAYGSVGIAPEEASGLVAKIIRDFRLQGSELKGKNLLKHSSGRKAAAAVIKELGERSQVVVVHKRYVLACKLFEYTFEPLISDVSMALYAVNFHKFIADLLYLSSVAHHPRATSLAERFEQAVRGDDRPLRSFLSVHSAATDDLVEALVSFCVFHRDTILRELADTKSEVRWLLDVTGTALNSLLISWSRRAKRLRVVCDESGPLGEARSYFDAWIGRDDKPSIRLGDKQIDFGFNLAEPVSLARSHECPGIQLADVVAAVAVAAFIDPSEKWSKDVLGSMFASGSIHPDGIVPEHDNVDLDLPETRLNVLILRELLRRSERAVSLTNGLPEFVQRMGQVVILNGQAGR